MKTRKQALILLPTLLSAALLLELVTGCSTSFKPDAIQTDQTPIGNIGGVLHGGQAPIGGAALYLYAAGTGGYGTGATSLMRAGWNTVADGNGNYYVTTDANGSFNISGDYTCTAGQQVYIIAVGGDAGAGPNSAITQMAGLGTCPAGGDLAAQVPFVTINEVSTVVFAYAMGGFGSSAYDISSDAGVRSNSNAALAQTGMTNAMANVSNILNIGKGTAYTKAQGNANSTVPQKEINTLANILAACVNSTGPSSSQCSTLLNDAVSLTGTAATDESTAIFNIVHNPAAYNPTTKVTNVQTLFNLQQTQYIFTPYLGTAPTDWTLPIVYSGLVTFPVDIAFDTAGNAWIGDLTRAEVIEVGPQGAVSTFNKNQANGNAAFGEMGGVAVAPDGTIWATDLQKNQVYIMSPSGTVTSYISGNLSQPVAIAFGYLPGDSTDWYGYVANYGGNSISIFKSNGSFDVTESPGVDEPTWVTVDSQGDALVPSSAGTGIIGEVQTVTNPSTGKVTWQTTTIGATTSYTVAIDGNGSGWFGNLSNPSNVYAMSSSTTTNKTGTKTTTSYSIGTSYSKGSVATSYRVGVDGADTVWISNASNSVTGWNQTARTWIDDSSTAGIATGGAATGVCIAVTPDGSGNLWTANTDGTVTQLLGVAAPTATPLIPSNYGQRP